MTTTRWARPLLVDSDAVEAENATDNASNASTTMRMRPGM
eukprot:CAMPEP_0176145292 /NCGR_PEP_ID=MMETSP0120_2-20121206/73999_1 /TAXON_ID=160619 /ORGANISM="Kryptoperidinium foliaceum, Strain CCMP 1326" /LENGTH=39 /DNA_ID= /DNA_START= /DNA_END= /DNA_ORIENTATION=